MSIRRQQYLRSFPVAVGEVHEVNVKGMSRRGDAGVAEVQGFSIIVPNTKPGDYVKIRIKSINKVGRGYGIGEVVAEAANSLAPKRPSLSTLSKREITILKALQLCSGRGFYYITLKDVKGASLRVYPEAYRMDLSDDAVVDSLEKLDGKNLVHGYGPIGLHHTKYFLSDYGKEMVTKIDRMTTDRTQRTKVTRLGTKMFKLKSLPKSKFRLRTLQEATEPTHGRRKRKTTIAP